MSSSTTSTAAGGLPGGDAVPINDLYADDQRGRIIGSCVAIFVITDVFVLLRLVSRKLARAGYWVSVEFLAPWRHLMGAGRTVGVWSMDCGVWRVEWKWE